MSSEITEPVTVEEKPVEAAGDVPMDDETEKMHRAAKQSESLNLISQKLAYADL